MTTATASALTIAEAASLIAAKRLSPVDLTKEHLERIARLDSALNAYLLVTEEIALAEAKAAEQRMMLGRLLGPLDGIPMAYKDLYATKGIRTTAHSQALADWCPDFDSTAVAKLRGAGAVMLGKLSMHEFATGGPAMDSPWAPAKNPWKPSHIPGGSSSGSGTALAALMCMGSLGSDTGGSIRGPASLCGIVGLKPTYGRVSRFGVVALSWSLDHAGPMTRTVEDCALMLQTIAGYDGSDPASAPEPVGDYTVDLKRGVAGLTIGVPTAYFMNPDEVNAETLLAVEAAIEVYRGLGASIVEVEWPSLELSAGAGVISAMEAYAYHEGKLKTMPERFGALARNRFRLGGILSAADYLQAQRARSVMRQEAAAIMSQVDVLLTPTSAAPANSFESFDPLSQYRNRPSFTRPFNMTGQPAVSIPCGFTADGLPIGLQIAGRPFDEAMVLRVAYAYEEATGWSSRHPDL